MRTAPLSSGYLYDFFHALGLSKTTSAHLESSLSKPVAVVFLIAGTILLARLGGRAIRKTLGRLRQRTAKTDPARASRIDTVSRIVANLWRVIIDAIGVFVVLSTIGLNLTPFLAGATIIGATIGFGAQSMVRDFLSGFLMLIEDQYRIGDVVVINEISGRVDEVSLRVTRLRDADGTEWYIPNGQILKVGNKARHWSRAIVKAQIAINVDIAEATALLDDAIREAVKQPALEGTLVSEPKVLGVSKVTANAITIDIEIRTQPLAELVVERALLEVATDALRRGNMLPPSEP
ncbi:MAG TPA: mechanosensitive ion channel family protein [Acidimicrobiales bacterium]|nr:mechanosensitive ion channel family protein [Acidimicrobiales bacterium]